MELTGGEPNTVEMDGLFGVVFYMDGTQFSQSAEVSDPADFSGRDLSGISMN